MVDISALTGGFDLGAVAGGDLSGIDFGSIAAGFLGGSSEPSCA